ncbi:hypothetical protein ACU4GD_14535 [Cupriavidus basilensis]
MRCLLLCDKCVVDRLGQQGLDVGEEFPALERYQGIADHCDYVRKPVADGLSAFHEGKQAGQRESVSPNQPGQIEGTALPCTRMNGLALGDCFFEEDC